MAQYIDKSALVAEIKKRIKAHKNTLKNYCNSSITGMTLRCSMGAYQSLLYFLDTLEDEEAGLDFEKELYKTFGQIKDFTLGMCIAKHFFELGLKAQKGE